MAPVLDQTPDLLPLLLAGKRGDPRLVRLRFHHPIAGCECPSFGLSDYEIPDDPESFDGALLDSWVYVVFPAGVPNGHDFVASKYFGFTRYELTGYFSGRLVNFYGWAAAQNDVHEDSPIGGEQEGDRQARYAEFCVEDWCYRPDPDPVRHKQVMSPSEVAADRAEYAQILTEMRRAGARRCGNPQQGQRSGKPETQL